MAKTVVFDRYQQVVFPHLCAGCLMPEPHAEMHLVTGRMSGKSMAAKLALRAGTLATGVMLGGIPMTLLKRATGQNEYTTIVVPVCEKCLQSLTPEEQKRVKGGFSEDPGDFFIAAIRNRFLHCKVHGNSVRLTLEQDGIAASLVVLNDGVKPEGAAAAAATDPAPAAESGEPAGSANEEAPVTPKPLPQVGEAERRKYSAAYQRDLPDLDLLLIDRWRGLVGELTGVFTYPKIPEKKLANAQAQYASLQPADILVGLHDSTVGGSGREGAVFTTRFFTWKFGDNSGRLNYADIPAARLEARFHWPNTSIMHGDKEIKLNLGNKKALFAIVAFLNEAGRIMKGSG
jgi:hypothetical protein